MANPLRNEIRNIGHIFIMPGEIVGGHVIVQNKSFEKRN